MIIILIIRLLCNELSLILRSLLLYACLVFFNKLNNNNNKKIIIIETVWHDE